MIIAHFDSIANWMKMIRARRRITTNHNQTRNDFRLKNSNLGQWQLSLGIFASIYVYLCGQHNSKIGLGCYNTTNVASGKGIFALFSVQRKDWFALEAQPLHVPGVQNTHYTGGAAVVVLDMVVVLPNENPTGVVADAVAAATTSPFSWRIPACHHCWKNWLRWLPSFQRPHPHHHHPHHLNKKKRIEFVGLE